MNTNKQVFNKARGNSFLMTDSVIDFSEYDATSVLTGELLVDQSHPFFFDHKLDHVPGLLLAEGMRQVATQAVAKNTALCDYFVSHFDVSFNKYCFFESAIVIRVESLLIRNNEVHLSVEVTQEGKVRANSSIIFSTIPVQSIDKVVVREGTKKAIPVDASVLNKSNQDNVFIEQINEELFRISHESVDNLLNRTTDQFHNPLYLLECFMQTRRYHNSLKIEKNKPTRFRDILRNISMTLVSPVSRTSTLYIQKNAQLDQRVCSRTVSNASDLLFEREVIGSFNIITARIEQTSLPSGAQTKVLEKNHE